MLVFMSSENERTPEEKQTFMLECAEAICAEIRARGVEINALLFLDAARAADEKLAAKLGAPEIDEDVKAAQRVLAAVEKLDPQLLHLVVGMGDVGPGYEFAQAVLAWRGL